MQGPELLAQALALTLDVEIEEITRDEAVELLVETAGGSGTALMGAYAYGLCLSRDMPYDTSSERMLGLLTQALQRAVRECGDYHAEESTRLLALIVEASGKGSVAPVAVAARTAELEADIENLRPRDDEEEPHGELAST